MKIKSLFVIMVVLCTLLSGCKSQNKQTTKQISDKILSKSSLNEISTDYDYKQVFGNVKVKTIREQMDDGRPWCQLEISNKGEIFGFTAAAKGNLSQLLVYNLNTGKAEVYYTVKDNFQPLFFTYNDDYLSWLEYTPSNNLPSRVMLYNRKTKETTEISKNIDNLTDVLQCKDALSKDYVLWTGIQSKDNINKYYIYKYDIKSGKNSIFQENAINPIIGIDFVAWLAAENSKNSNSSVYVQTLKDNMIKKITHDQNPLYIATDGSSIVYSGNDNLDYIKSQTSYNALHNLTLYNNKKTVDLSKSIPCYFEFTEISKNFIGWSQDQKIRVYYRKKNKMAVLSTENANCSTVLVSDKYFMWNSPVNKDEMVGKQQAIDDGMALSDLHIICVDDIK